MGFDNKGRIGPAAGPQGHTHSIYQLNDVAASSVDYQTLISNDGIWTAQAAIPYAMMTGTYTYPDAIVSLAPNASLLLTNVVYTNGKGTPFTTTPVVHVSTSGFAGGTGVLFPKVQGSNINGFNIYIVNLGSVAVSPAANALTLDWTAIQMKSDTSFGATSTDARKA
jgi:hypothetical protein